MLIDHVEVASALAESDEWAWPLSVPAIRDVAKNGLTFTNDLVVLVGANGSGKSTLLEGIAEAYGLDVRGGHGGRRYSSPLDKSPLGDSLRLHRTSRGSRIWASSTSKTFPIGSHRLNTQGQTSPFGEIAATPSPQRPHNCAVLGCWSRTPRPTCRNRS